MKNYHLDSNDKIDKEIIEKCTFLDIQLSIDNFNERFNFRFKLSVLAIMLIAFNIYFSIFRYSKGAITNTHAILVISINFIWLIFTIIRIFRLLEELQFYTYLINRYLENVKKKGESDERQNKKNKRANK